MRFLNSPAYRRTLILALLIAVLALSAIFSLRGHAIADLKRALKKVQAQQEKLIEEDRHLKENFARKDDLRYIEYLARRELGLLRAGEEKYILMERGP
ncbi:MAG: hypothetical protein A2Z21_06960 [Candidatus Fraserbacteria bacterium RBG_16_55_9]|uniref:Septum formation initiator n=1 Tax=Fraserbacteria sp. (strain RBG_16_55_9) TaxID=1817864 RepID=A0A1F5URP9_FRAXR|nr:MAG: hypothetical protein A2Z21_06960 [Candidatus Fraserbacteria bacterium RBG_16_55_9]